MGLRCAMACTPLDWTPLAAWAQSRAIGGPLSQMALYAQRRALQAGWAAERPLDVRARLCVGSKAGLTAALRLPARRNLEVPSCVVDGVPASGQGDL